MKREKGKEEREGEREKGKEERRGRE